ncbi:MAG: GNAT family acetyltransferase [Chryseobacterium sp.]|nr:MAG: GNAT family acetyltransferase [Chryseobacterium sp.]
MKKLNKVKMKSIIVEGQICLECATGNYPVITEGRCYCIPID